MRVLDILLSKPFTDNVVIADPIRKKYNRIENVLFFLKSVNKLGAMWSPRKISIPPKLIFYLIKFWVFFYKIECIYCRMNYILIWFLFHFDILNSLECIVVFLINPISIHSSLVPLLYIITLKLFHNNFILIR